MNGRRVNRSTSRHNPLYILFLCLVAAVFILLITVIVLGAKLGATNKALEESQAQVEQLKEQIETLAEQGTEKPAVKPDDSTPSKEERPNEGSQGSSSSKEEGKQLKVDWLDLTGHSELAVLPKALFDDYYTYYATDGVNMRGGPATSYERIQTVTKGAAVKAAAKDGDWTFVKVGDKFGWIKSEYLSTTKPVVETPPVSGGNEATSGNLNP